MKRGRFADGKPALQSVTRVRMAIRSFDWLSEKPLTDGTKQVVRYFRQVSAKQSDVADSSR